MRVFMTPTKLLCHLCLLRYVTVDIQMWSFLLGCHRSPLSVAKEKLGGGGRVGFVAAGKGRKRFVGASQWLEQEETIVIPAPLTVCRLFEYVHVSKKHQTAEVSPQTYF